MKFRTIVSCVLVAIAIIVWTGCSKPGPQGPAGMDGNANVVASQWYSPNSWSGLSGDWYFDVSNSEITKDVVESGAILAYFSVPGDVNNDFTVRPLPAYAIGANWDFLLLNDNQSTYGQIEFTSTMVNRPGTSGYNFRFIIIPASFILKSARIKSTKVNDLKNMSYQEVCKLFSIKE